MALGGGGPGTANKSKDIRTQERPCLVQQVVESVAQHAHFVYRRGRGFHLLFDEAEMSNYFDRIRARLKDGTSGSILADAIKGGKLHTASTNQLIWKTLVRSQTFSGVDFEHTYGIIADGNAHLRPSNYSYEYNFEETIVLSHTLLLVPVMQHYGPLTPKLDLKGPTKKFDEAQPLLVAGMDGDCVKGPFFDDICKRAAEGCDEAIEQKNTLLHPQRLQQKFRGLVRGLLQARPADSILRIDATLVGSGAFGGSTQALAQPFVDSLDDCLDFAPQDEVNFFIFPPPKQEDCTLEHKKYKTELNPKSGLGAAQAAENTLRVVVAGLDPVSITPHGVNYRAVSAEGQICHATTMLECISNLTGQFMQVKVPSGQAWESPAAFFAKELKTKQEDSYDTVRFVPEVALQACDVGLGAEVQLVARENVPLRAWNGDAFDGWKLLLHETPTTPWGDVIKEAICEGIRKVFRRLDKHGDGMVVASTLQGIFGRLGVSDKFTENLLLHIGTSQDGRIAIDGFLSWVGVG
eukprot:TRINITY_DN2372_c0_g2_i1.p1 TRINITY_DN2372_c0_g2~~TRINITY_DN2372_c0_g2_i1.p1  ORF type:complete len:521 (-),score=65.62 TRINITY_DN2372_c0_g2_i1:434-1996(-)